MLPGVECGLWMYSQGLKMGFAGTPRGLILARNVLAGVEVVGLWKYADGLNIIFLSTP